MVSTEVGKRKKKKVFNVFVLCLSKKQQETKNTKKQKTHLKLDYQTPELTLLISIHTAYLHLESQ